MPTTETDVNAAIRAALDDDGRCWRECGTCGGSKFIHTPGCGVDDKWCHGTCKRHGKCMYSRRCPKCDNGRVYDGGRLAKAMFHKVFHADTCGGDKVGVSIFGKEDWNYRYPRRRDDVRPFLIRLWQNRHDQPWQGELEKWVHGVPCIHCTQGEPPATVACGECSGTGWISPPWEKEAPDYATEAGMVELKRLLTDHDWKIEKECLEDRFVYHVDLMNRGKWHTGTGPTEHEALFAAVLAALGLGETGND